MMNDEGQNEYRFFISATSKQLNEVFAVPIKCLGQMASEVYAQVTEGDYVELVGELIRLAPDKCYVLAKEVLYKKPNSRTSYYIRSSEFLELYSPQKVLEKMTGKKEDELLKEQRITDEVKNAL